MNQLFASGCQNIGASTSASVLPMNIQGWFPLGQTGLNQLYKYIYPLIPISFPFRSPQSIKSSLNYTIGSHWYFILSISSVYMSIPASQFNPLLLPPCIHLFLSLCLFFYFCFANKFKCILFLDSTYKWYYAIFVFLFLTSLCVKVSRSLHASAYGSPFLFMAE